MFCSLRSLIRCIASITTTVSFTLSRLASWPVSTSPVTSLAWSTLTGRTERSIRPAGAMELPPESDAREPISVASDPSAPALWIPYMGLCGLLLVSFSERAAITAPFTEAAVAGETRSMMPRRNALSEWNARPSRVSVKLVLVATLVMPGSMSPGRPSLPYPAVLRKSSCPPAPPISTFEPTMLAPPARSMQMNGIFPAPSTSMPQLCLERGQVGGQRRPWPIAGSRTG